MTIDLNAFNALLSSRFLSSAEKMAPSNEKKLAWKKVHTLSLVNLETGLVKSTDSDNKIGYYHLPTELLEKHYRGLAQETSDLMSFAKEIVKYLKQLPSHLQVPIKLKNNPAIDCIPNLIGRTHYIYELCIQSNLLDLFSHAEDNENPKPNTFTVSHEDPLEIGRFLARLMVDTLLMGKDIEELIKIVSNQSTQTHRQNRLLLMKAFHAYKKNRDFDFYVLNYLQSKQESAINAENIKDYVMKNIPKHVQLHIK